MTVARVSQVSVRVVSNGTPHARLSQLSVRVVSTVAQGAIDYLGSSSGSATAAAVGASRRAAAGSAAGAGSASGASSFVPAGRASGSSAGQATASAVGRKVVAVTGTAAGSASVIGASPSPLTYIQAAVVESSSSGSSIATAGMTTATGRHLFAFVSWRGGSPTEAVTITDTAGNGWTQLPTVWEHDLSGRWYYALGATGHASNVVTATWPAGRTHRVLRVIEMGGGAPNRVLPLVDTSYGADDQSLTHLQDIAAGEAILVGGATTGGTIAAIYDATAADSYSAMSAAGSAGSIGYTAYRVHSSAATLKHLFNVNLPTATTSALAYTLRLGAPPHPAMVAGASAGAGRSTAAAPGGSGPIPHRYWRLRVDAVQAGFSTVSIAEFVGRAGGANLTAEGAVAISSGDAVGLPASRVMDENDGTSWRCDTTTPPWFIGIDYGADNARALTHLSVTVPATSSGRPQAGAVQWSDDGTSWSTTMGYADLPWTAGETKLLPPEFVGTALASSSASAASATRRAATGTAAASSTAAAFSPTFAAATGTAAGSSAASATPSPHLLATGTSAGTATAQGVGAARFRASGAAAGSSAAAGATRVRFSATGSASAAAVVTGQSAAVRGVVGHAAGAASVFGMSGAIVVSVGSTAGSATALARGPGSEGTADGVATVVGVGRAALTSHKSFISGRAEAFPALHVGSVHHAPRLRSESIHMAPALLAEVATW